MKGLIFPLMMSFLLVQDARGQKPTAAPVPFRVLVEVTADEPLRSEITSTLNRLLRQFTDVQLVGEDPTYIIRIVALEDNSACSVAALVTHPYGKINAGVLGNLYSDEKSQPGMLKAMQDSVAKHEQFCSLQTWILSVEMIDQLLKRIVAKFDVDRLEPDRKSLQTLFESQKRHASEKTKRPK